MLIALRSHPARCDRPAIALVHLGWRHTDPGCRPKGTPMTLAEPVDKPIDGTTSRQRRSWWLAGNTVLAVSAVTVAVVALARDPGTTTVQLPAPTVASAATADAHLPANVYDVGGEHAA